MLQNKERKFEWEEKMKNKENLVKKKVVRKKVYQSLYTIEQIR